MYATRMQKISRIIFNMNLCHFHMAVKLAKRKCAEIIKAREGHAKLFFWSIKYAKFVALSLSLLFRVARDV